MRFFKELLKKSQIFMRVYHSLLNIRLVIKYGSLSNKQRFEKIYEENTWQSMESRSGEGSTILQTGRVRDGLMSILDAYSITSFLDIPCGDFNWMQYVPLGSVSYCGADIVDEIIRLNNSKFATSTKTFCVLDIIHDDLPEVDLVLCRDCLVHFSNDDIFKAIKNIKRSGARYLLSTSFAGRATNANIVTGSWRPLNLQTAPFFFPTPILTINEGSTEDNGRWSDKSLCLWEINSLSAV